MFIYLFSSSQTVYIFNCTPIFLPGGVRPQIEIPISNFKLCPYTHSHSVAHSVCKIFAHTARVRRAAGMHAVSVCVCVCGWYGLREAGPAERRRVRLILHTLPESARGRGRHDTGRESVDLVV